MYVDPGSGSYLVQVLFATVIGGVVAFRSVFQRVMARVTHLIRRILP